MKITFSIDSEDIKSSSYHDFLDLFLDLRSELLDHADIRLSNQRLTFDIGKDNPWFLYCLGRLEVGIHNYLVCKLGKEYYK